MFCPLTKLLTLLKECRIVVSMQPEISVVNFRSLRQFNSA
ncbi:MAG: hypothetical protein K0S79_10 [Nitrospira sp.]|jgi:hypothetical protein|nr:hypothetical protein [Nitrospira sp.]